MKLLINQCMYQDLLTLPGVGRRVADRIWEIFTTKGFIVEDDLTTIPYLIITRALMDSIDFAPLPDETLDDNLGFDKGEESRFDQEHYERVKRLDDLFSFKGREFKRHTKPYIWGTEPLGVSYKDETRWSSLHHLQHTEEAGL